MSKRIALLTILPLAWLAGCGQASLDEGPADEALSGESAQALSQKKEARRLFEQETFGGNGRTCLTCHSRETGTVSPQDAQHRFATNPADPLFLADGSLLLNQQIEHGRPGLGVIDLPALLASEAGQRDLAVQRLQEGRYFPGFFLILTQKGGPA